MVALAAGLALVPAVPAMGDAHDPRGPVDLGGVPAVGLLRAGRVLVLRPNRLEVVLGGRLVRTVAVRQPVDLAQLPSLVHDPAYAAPLAEGTRGATGAAAGTGILLGAVLAQRPGTAVTAAGLHLRLADTGGAGPARLTGTRARLTLRDARIDADPAAPASAPVAAGFRYLHGSNLSLDGVTLTGLGARGTPALRADGGSAVALKHLSLTAGGPGVELRDPVWLTVEGLDGQRVGGALLTVSGGSGAHLKDVSSSGSSGPALRLRGAAGTTVDGLTSTGDAAALVAQDVDAVHARRVRARGERIVLGGRGIELTDADVDAGVDAARATPARRDADEAARRVPWWDRPVRGTGAVAVVVLVAGVLLEVLRGRRRGGEVDGSGNRSSGHGDGVGAVLPGAALDGDGTLDLGEERVH